MNNSEFGLLLLAAICFIIIGVIISPRRELIRPIIINEETVPIEYHSQPNTINFRYRRANNRHFRHPNRSSYSGRHQH